MAEINQSSSRYNAELKAVLEAIQADITALDTAFDTLVAKLNADAGVTDVDYAGAADMTTTIPA